MEENFLSVDSLEALRDVEDRCQLKTYAKYPIALERGLGTRVWDVSGREFLDFYSGHAVMLTGHCHPHVVQAIAAQAQKFLFYSNLVYHSTRARAAQALTRIAPPGLQHVFFCNSGTEANEAALKMARKHTDRTLVVSMQRGFHGRTYGSLSITGFAKYRSYSPDLGAVTFIEFGDEEAIIELFRRRGEEIAAVILEPVQSMAGVRVASASYLQQLRSVCDAHGALLIFDEIQTAIGRCGAPFYAQIAGVIPDIISLAKGIASGVPMGATLVSDDIAGRINHGDHGTTFGGGPLACAALLATLEVIEQEGLCLRAKEAGSILVQSILRERIPGLREVRGAGLLLGLEFETNVKPLISSLLSHGVIVGSSEDPNTLRLLPPLIVSAADCEQFMCALRLACGKASLNRREGVAP